MLLFFLYSLGKHQTPLQLNLLGNDRVSVSDISNAIYNKLTVAVTHRFKNFFFFCPVPLPQVSLSVYILSVVVALLLFLYVQKDPYAMDI